MSSIMTKLLNDTVHEQTPIKGEVNKRMIFKFVGNKEELLYALSEKLVEEDNARDNKIIAQHEFNLELEAAINN